MTSTSPHIIRRQTLEVEVSGDETAGFALGRTLPELCGGSLVHAIERVLEKYAPAGEHLAIERLEVDAGTLSLHALELELPEAVAEALDKELGAQAPPAGSTEASGAMRRKSGAEAARQAFLYFLNTGSLPWWFQVPAGETLEQVMMASWQAGGAVGQAGSLFRRVAELLSSPDVRERLVSQFSPGFLEALLAGVSPRCAQAMREIRAQPERRSPDSLTGKRMAALLWRTALGAAATGGSVTASSLVAAFLSTLTDAERRDPALRGLLEERWDGLLAPGGASDDLPPRVEARSEGFGPAPGVRKDAEPVEQSREGGFITSRRTAAAGHDEENDAGRRLGTAAQNTQSPGAVQGPGAVRGTGRDAGNVAGPGLAHPAERSQGSVQGTASQGGGKAETAAGQSAGQPESGARQGKSAEAASAGGRSGHVADTHPEGVPLQDTHEAREAAEVTRKRAIGAGAPEAEHREEGDRSRGLGPVAANTQGPGAGQRPTHGPIGDAESGSQAETAAGQPAGLPESGARPGKHAETAVARGRGRRLDRLDLTEGVFVRCAGLVLLHPFLPRFFETLGVAGEDRLTQPDRALCLMHFLATGQTVAPEYELVLPKLLCNVPLEAPAAADVALTPAEQEEGARLLAAVIRHWDALRDSSPDALRGTFLLRPGKLTQRADGDYLLQVEKQAFDILLDALPWGIGAVKLPWMPEILWVEWH